MKVNLVPLRGQNLAPEDISGEEIGCRLGTVILYSVRYL